MDIETVIVSILTAFLASGVVGYFINNYLSQKRETELRMQQDNRGHYESWMVYMRLLMRPDRLSHFNIHDPTVPTLTKIDDIRNHAKDKLTEFYYTAVFFCPDFVLSAIKEFLEKPNEENLMKTAIAMRKDLWKKETNIDLKTLSLEQK